jgi:metacaspase-1
MPRTKPRPATRTQPATAGPKRKARKRALCVGINDYPYDGNDLKEYSYDAMIDGTYHGALTCYALRAIRKAQYDLSWAQLHQQVLHLIEDYPQHPQLEGRRDAKRRPIFR